MLYRGLNARTVAQQLCPGLIIALVAARLILACSLHIPNDG